MGKTLYGTNALLAVASRAFVVLFLYISVPTQEEECLLHGFFGQIIANFLFATKIC